MKVNTANQFPNIVDFHAHILPGADHGSSSTSVSCTQLNLALQNGVTRVVATPHFYPQSMSVDSFIKRRDEAYSKLVSSLQDQNHPKIAKGAEILMCNNIENMPEIERLTIGSSNILLLELPEEDYVSDPVRSVKALLDKGFEIMLAHADRYDPSRIDPLLVVGAKIQLNAPAVSALFIKRHIRRWITRGSVMAIGSDIHGASLSFYRNFRKASKKIARLYGGIISLSDSLWQEIIE